MLVAVFWNRSKLSYILQLKKCTTHGTHTIKLAPNESCKKLKVHESSLEQLIHLELLKTYYEPFSEKATKFLSVVTRMLDGIILVMTELIGMSIPSLSEKATSKITM